MQIKNIIIAAALLPGNSVLAQSSGGFTIKGHFDHLPEGKKLCLVRRDRDKGLDTIDCSISHNGHFSFKGKLANPEALYIFREDEHNFSFVFAENTHMQVSGDVDSMLAFRGIEVKGSRSHDQLIAFYQTVSVPFEKEIMQLYAIPRVTTAEKEQLAEEVDAIEDRRATAILAYIKTHPQQTAGLPYGIITAYNSLGITLTPAAYTPVYDALTPASKASVYGKKFREKLDAALRTAPGVAAPDFTMPTANGESVQLKKLIATSKVVLLDFWASWCGPCRAENPNIHRAWEKYHDKGLTILSISVDTDREKWLKAVKEDSVPWLQVSDLTERAETARRYGVSGIPHLVLIGADGKIITSRNIRGEELHKKLDELLK